MMKHETSERTDPSLRVAVIGLGYWGPNLVRNLQSLESCGEVVLFDTNPAQLGKAMRQFPAATAAASFEAVLEDASIPAVVVATPVRTHYDLASRALEAGKNVLVEKPLTSSYESAVAMVARAGELGKVVMAGHTFLHSPPVKLVKQLIREGQIGDPLYVQSSRMNLGVHQSDVSVLWDLAPHDLSILVDWLGEYPVRVSAIGRATHGMERADVAFMNLEFPSGCIASLHLSWLAPTKIRRTTLVGTQRMVVYEDTNTEEPLKIYDKGIDLADPQDFGAHQLTYRTGDVRSPRVDVYEPLKAELQVFLERVAEEGGPDEREDTAVAIVRAIEAAEESLRTGGLPIELGAT